MSDSFDRLAYRDEQLAVLRLASELAVTGPPRRPSAKRWRAA
jgi:hypothetical protein